MTPERAVVVRVLGEIHCEDDVGSRYGLTVLPAGISAHVERVGQTIGRDRPGASQVGQQRAVRTRAQQTSEQQGHEVAVDLRARRQRVDRARMTDHAFAVRGGRAGVT